MRKLLILRGPQGAGKSRLLQTLKLTHHTLSADELRLMLGGPVMGIDGRLHIPQDKSMQAWRMLHELLEQRLEAGETVVVDGTFAKASDMKIFVEKAQMHRYALACMDFYPMPLEQVLAQNAERDLRRVDEEVVRKTYATGVATQIPPGFQHILWQADDRHIDQINAFLDLPIVDLSEYEAVVHVGDLQGCFTVLAGPDAPLERGLNPRHFYVFVGDLLDRGIENGQVMQWALDELVGAPNAVLLWGNHELHIHRFARGLPPVSQEFAQYTLPQLERSGITPSMAERVVAFAQEAFFYTWRGQSVFCSHAGLASIPDQRGLIHMDQYVEGTGGYEAPVDAAFSALAPSGWVQVHGHRNSAMLPVQAGPRSFNLEGGVEFGGHLRLLELNKDGFVSKEVRNMTYRPLSQRLLDDQKRQRPRGSALPYPTWALDPEAARAVMDPELVARLQQHPLIKSSASEKFPHIFSLNFSKEAFWTKAWDNLTTHARGLFLAQHGDQYSIVARAYEKFFNLGERPETLEANLRTSLTFPVKAYVKENGYLGILGYDAQTQRLLFCSKSKTELQFADRFEEILRAQVGEGVLELMLRYLRDTGSSMTFEVNDSVCDPHIIVYDQPHVVLLDVVRRASVFEKLDYDDLVKLGKKLHLPVKELGATFQEADGLFRFLNKVMNDTNWQWKGRHIEGFVLEDAQGFQFKVKGAWYAFWKHLRGVKDRVLKGRHGKTLTTPEDPQVLAFFTWAMQQPDTALMQNITVLRNAYLQDPTSVLPGEAPVMEILPQHEGLRRGLEALTEHARAGTAKPESVRKMLASSLQDPAKLAVVKSFSDLPVLLACVQDPAFGAQFD